MASLAARNRVDLASFLGAGVYHHHLPATVDTILSRGEFDTAYTPYQPEISQGTLQTIYEYQSLLAELTGLPVVSASHYDGAAATAEAALMTIRATGRDRVLVSRAVHRHYLETTRTYFSDGRHELEELPTLADGTTDLAALEAGPRRRRRGRSRVCCSASPMPSGCSSRWPRPHAWRTPPVRCSWRSWSRSPWPCWRHPGEIGADIAVGEGQPLGIAPQYGGPYLGVLATTEALMRQVPGRLVGRTLDLDGRRAYVMTLRAREQDIRRDKAASNICTNQALCALAATVYLATLGPHGLRDVAAGGAAAAARRLESALAGGGRADASTTAPTSTSSPSGCRTRCASTPRCWMRAVLAGLPLARWYPDDPELRDALLVCATEVTTDAEIDRFAAALAARVAVPA